MPSQVLELLCGHVKVAALATAAPVTAHTWTKGLTVITVTFPALTAITHSGD